MSTKLEPADWSPPLTGGEHAVREWLDALADGHCDPETFSRAMRERFRSDRNGNWEVLSLLDQYFRRGKIKPEVFQAVNSRLVVSALGATEDTAPVMDAETRSAAPTITVSAAPTIAPSATPTTASSAAPTTPRSAPVRPKPRATPASAMPRAARAAALQEKSHPDRDLAVGDVLRGRYRLVAELNDGESGTVFEAIDEYRLDLASTDQRVAIKVLRAAGQQREFQHLQLLSHPNIVRVHEIDLDGGIAFYTMELLNGALLIKLLRARNGAPLPRPYSHAIIRDVGAALAYAHSRGIVHGELSPQNIFLTNDGEVRVFDFGGAQQLIDGRDPDFRDDVFAFSCIAYVLLSGRHPFPEHTAVEARMERLRPSRPPGLSGNQWRALRAGLHWERAKRPSDVAKWLAGFELQAAPARLPPLSTLNEAPPPRDHRLILRAAAVAVFALLVAAGYRVLTTDGDPRVMSALSGIGARIARLTATSSPKPEPLPVPAPHRSTSGIPTTPHTTPHASSSGSSATPAATPAATPGAAPAAAAGAAPTAAPGSAPAARPGTARAAVVAATPPQAPRPQVSHGAAAAGPVHIEMAEDTIDLPAYERTAHVVVRRKGSSRGDSRFTWWTESGTAKPGVDFVAVAPHGAEFSDGDNTLSLNIRLPYAPHIRPRSFYVVIGPVDSGAILGARTLTMVTILPPEG